MLVQTPTLISYSAAALTRKVDQLAAMFATVLSEHQFSDSPHGEPAPSASFSAHSLTCSLKEGLAASGEQAGLLADGVHPAASGAAVPPSPEQVQLAVATVTRNSRVLMQSSKSLQQVFCALAECGYSRSEVTLLAARAPNLLCKSARSIHVTASVLRDLGYTSAHVLKFPTALSYSVAERLVPRHEFCVSLGRGEGAGRLGLSSLLSPTNAEFSRRLTGDPQAYCAWQQQQQA